MSNWRVRCNHGNTYKNGTTIIASCLMINVVRNIGNTYFDILNKTILINVELCCVYARFDLEIDLDLLKLGQTGQRCVKI